MNKNERPFQMKGKGAAVGIVICFVAVIALIGTYTFRNYQNEMDEQMAEAEKLQQTLEEETEQANTEDIVLPEAETEEETPEEAQEETGTSDTEEDTGSLAGEADTASGNTAAVSFSEDSILDWPASGSVLMNYSMDQTTYFATLDQYRYNPALIIEGEEGEPIYASAAGTVAGVEETAQTGLTVTLDMGGGYQAVYGQLKELPVAQGQYVEKGELIGYLSQPTKYYSEEGTNLYFEILKDGEPVDPMNYME